MKNNNEVLTLKEREDLIKELKKLTFSSFSKEEKYLSDNKKFIIDFTGIEIKEIKNEELYKIFLSKFKLKKVGEETIFFNFFIISYKDKEYFIPDYKKKDRESLKYIILSKVPGNDLDEFYENYYFK